MFFAKRPIAKNKCAVITQYNEIYDGIYNSSSPIPFSKNSKNGADDGTEDGEEDEEEGVAGEMDSSSFEWEWDGEL